MLNFTISELIYSEIAMMNNIDNIPSVKHLDNLLNLIFYCLQPIRNILNKPMIVTSGYRCEKLNLLVGGKINSQHKIGCAIDFVVKNMSVSQVIEVVKKSDVEYDQLINEYDKWIHISFSKNKNRKQILKIK